MSFSVGPITDSLVVTIFITQTYSDRYLLTRNAFVKTWQKWLCYFVKNAFGIFYLDHTAYNAYL